MGGRSRYVIFVGMLDTKRCWPSAVAAVKVLNICKYLRFGGCPFYAMEAIWNEPCIYIKYGRMFLLYL